MKRHFKRQLLQRFMLACNMDFLPAVLHMHLKGMLKLAVLLRIPYALVNLGSREV